MVLLHLAPESSALLNSWAEQPVFPQTFAFQRRMVSSTCKIFDFALDVQLCAPIAAQHLKMPFRAVLLTTVGFRPGVHLDTAEAAADH